jgi:hypothetical protein
LARGDNIRSTLDLRAKRGAQLFLAIGAGGTTDIAAAGPDVLIRRVLNNDGAAHRYAAGLRLTFSAIDTATRLLNNGAGYAAGSVSFAFDGHGGKAAALQDKWFFWGVDAIPGASGALNPVGSGCEVLRTSKGTATPLVVDRPCAYAHINNEILGLAESWSLWIPGGSLYEIVFDYGGQSAGEMVAVMADAQTYDVDTVT